MGNEMRLVYTAMTKKLAFFKTHISRFVLEQGKVPLNPFMLFDYFLLDTVDRRKFYEANASMIKRSDEVWVFGPVSDGVAEEISLAKKEGKPVRFFEVTDSKEIREIDEKNVRYEEDTDKI
ncbi:MAG: hypothetical protein JW754_04770 [Candidatus Aenigmarchaeota archaeon]|nr:hypothetical protein [Candidatus Aenigmarchaeota archaeon]